MPNVKRKTAKKTAAKKRAVARKPTKPKANRPKTAKKSVKLASRTMKAKKHALSPAEKRSAASRKSAATRKANALKRSAAAKKSAATRKANAAKSKRTATAAAANRGARKRRAKKTATAKRTRRRVDGRSREARDVRRGRTYLKECAKLLLLKKYTDSQIRDMLAKKFGDRYSGGRHTRHIRKYRSLLNSGGLEHAGFKRPSKPVQEVGRTQGAEEAGLTKRARRARRSVIRQKRIGPRAKFARRRRLQSGVSSPGPTVAGNSSPDTQPIARRARRRPAVPR